jgi:hypothetical protein
MYRKNWFKALIKARDSYPQGCSYISRVSNIHEEGRSPAMPSSPPAPNLNASSHRPGIRHAAKPQRMPGTT